MCNFEPGLDDLVALAQQRLQHPVQIEPEASEEVPDLSQVQHQSILSLVHEHESVEGEQKPVEVAEILKSTNTPKPQQKGPKVVTVPSTKEVNELSSNKKLEDAMVQDLIDLHKSNKDLENYIVKDISLIDKTMSRYERGDQFKMPFSWASYVVRDISVIQKTNINSFLSGLKMFNITPSEDVPEDCTNMMYILYYFVVPAQIGGKVLSEAIFADIIWETNGSVHREIKARYEKG